MTAIQRIIQISDTHLAREPGPIRPGYPDSDRQLDAVLAALRAREPQPECLLLTGDLAEDPQPEAYARLLEHLTRHADGWPVAAVAGNHDDPATLQQVLAGAGHGVHGHRRLGDWLLVGLDSCRPGHAGGQLATDELDRLEDTLAQHPQAPSVIAVHHPPVPIGSAWMDRMGLANPAALFAVLDRHPQVRACVFGHIHQDFRGERRGVQLLGCPATCVQFRPHADQLEVDPRPAGYRVLELHADGRLSSRVERVTVGVATAEGLRA